MTATISGINDLRAAMSGSVLTPEDADYETARIVWNAEIDRRPAVIAQCVSAADVAAAVRFATAHDLEVAVRGGAHGIGGAAVVDDGIMIDLRRLNEVTVDPDAQRAKVGGGALLGDLDAAAQAHGLAVPAGMVSHTGVGGLTLGGGMGWLTRMHGLSIDNVVSAEVVTADGQIRRIDDVNEPDLFWAIRGGGGNFCVVTEFEFQLHPVGPLVQLGMVFWGVEQCGDVLRMAREVIASLPPELNILIAGLNAPPAPFVPVEHHFKPGIALMVVGLGDPAVHEEQVARITAALPPLFEFLTPIPYTELQKLLDEDNRWGQYYYDKGTYLEEITDAAIDVIVEHLPRKVAPGSVMLFYRLDGAYSKVADDATAFSGGRSPRYAMFMIAVCESLEQLAQERDWVRGFWTAVLPHGTSDVYVNTEIEDGGPGVVEAAYGGAKYARLAALKQQYDPDNVFCRNVNIKPSS